MSYEVEIVQRQPLLAAVVRGEASGAEMPAFLGRAFDAVLRVAGAQGSSPSGPPFARCRPREDGSFAVEAGFPVTGAVSADGPVEPSSLPGGSIARTLHVGAYDRVGAAYEALDAWVRENGYAGAEAPWESYLDDPSVPEPRTEVCLPCRPARGV